MLRNAHAHLELSGVPTPLDASGGMGEWVRRLTAFRRSPAYDPVAAIRSALDSTDAKEIDDIYQPSVPLDAYATATTVRKRLYYELIGWRRDDVEDRVAGAERFWDSMRACGIPSILPGLSPHAPQTVHRELLERAIDLANDRGVPIAMHLAESPGEMRLLADRTGPLLEMMRRVYPAYDPDEVLAGRRPLDYLRRLARVRNTHVTIIHGNYLDGEEISFLAAHADRFTVVYCPRSHAHFGHPEYPLRTMLRAGVRIALGTDSPASNGDACVAAEVRLVRDRFPDIPKSEIERMAGADEYGG